MEKISLTGTVAYGEAFAPYFLALSLWLGIVVTTFFFHYRRVREEMLEARGWERILVKLWLPFWLVIAQAIILTLGCEWALKMGAPVLKFLFVSINASLIFLIIIFSLILIFRDAGRLVALLFFVFQLAAAGGAFPVEMTGGFYQSASPILPFANVVKAFRAANLGAYDGNFLFFLAKSWMAALLLLALASLIARWKYVSDQEYTLAADI